MKTKDLIKYLLRFDLESDTKVITINLKKRIVYKLERISCVLTDDEPLLGLEIGDGEPFPNEAIKAAEEVETDEFMSPIG